MGYPNIPDIDPDINLDRAEIIDLLLASIGLEELSLAHLVNAEAEKLQRALGTLQMPGTDEYFPSLIDNSLENLLRVNREINKTLKFALQKEFILLTKLEDVIDFATEFTPPTPPLECDQCSIFGTNVGGPVPVTASINGENDLEGTATFLINICNNCNPTNNFNFLVNLGQGQNFNFTQGRSTMILECDPEEGTATFQGTIRLQGEVFDVIVNVTPSSVMFDATNQDQDADIESFSATLTTDNVNVEPCPREE